MPYQSKHTGKTIDNAIDKIAGLNGRAKQTVVLDENGNLTATDIPASIEKMEVGAETLSPDSQAVVNKEVTDGVIKLKFGVPAGQQGKDGVSGVHVGSDAPPESANVWINPNGQPTGTEDWEFEMADATTDTKTVVVIGADEANGQLAILKFKQDGQWMEIPAIVGSKGEAGVSGVHFGSEDPPESANIWINPNGKPTGTEDWDFEMSDNTTQTKTVVVIGADEANGRLAALKFRLADGSWAEIPAIVGETGKQGEVGADALLCNQIFSYRYSPGREVNTLFSWFNRAPKIGDTFITLCNMKYYTLFEITSVSGEAAVATSRMEVNIKGETGDPGISATHSWDGTRLTITSASGTSSADLRGAQGIPGESGVYIGPAPCPDWARVWINPDENPTNTEEWEFEMDDSTTVKKTVVVV